MGFLMQADHLRIDQDARAGSSALMRIAYGVMLLSICFYVIRLVPYVQRPTGGFLAAFTAGKMLVNHQDMRLLYDPIRFNEMIPLFTGLRPVDIYAGNTPHLPFLLAPFATLPAPEGKMAWELFSLVCLVIALFVILSHFRFNSLERAVMTGLVFGFNPLYTNFVYGHVYAPLFLIQVCIVRFWAEGKLLSAAIAMALLVALKGYGVLFLVMALFRKEWLMLLYALASYLVIVAVSSLAVGLDTWVAYASQLPPFLFSMPDPETYQQTLGSFLAWVMVHDRWNAQPGFDTPFLVLPFVAAFLIAGIVLLYRLLRQSSRLRMDLSFGVAIILGVLTAPRLFDYHYIFVLIPILACYRYLSRPASRLEITAFAIMLLLLSVKIPYYDEMFQKTWLGLAAFPRVYGGLILMWLLYRITKVTARPMIVAAA